MPPGCGEKSKRGGREQVYHLGSCLSSMWHRKDTRITCGFCRQLSRLKLRLKLSSGTYLGWLWWRLWLGEPTLELEPDLHAREGAAEKASWRLIWRTHRCVPEGSACGPCRTNGQAVWRWRRLPCPRCSIPCLDPAAQVQGRGREREGLHTVAPSPTLYCWGKRRKALSGL